MKKQPYTPLIIAHRGYSGNYPENTLEAFKGAISSYTDVIEVDLQLTKDNNVVLFHDRTVHRIFDQNLYGKSIQDYTLTDLKKKDFGSWFNPSFSFCRIVTLDEFFNFLPKDFPVILEIKGEEDELINKTIKFLVKNNIKLGRGYISVRDIETLNKVKIQSNLKHRIGLMQKKRTAQEFLEILKKENVSIAQIRTDYWNGNNFHLLKALPVEIMVFYADTYNEYSKWFKKKVSGIFTNYPSKLKTFLNEQKKNF